MKIDKPTELVEKEVCDTNGNVIGKIDKIWKSWNDDYPGHFFGVKTNENARDTFFRGTQKLVPIYSDYIREVSEHVTLNKTMDDLCRNWNKTVPCGRTTYPLDKLFEMPVFDKNQSRVGTFCSYVESNGIIRHFGLWLDPYLCETWNVSYYTTMPIETNYIMYVKDTINLDKTLDELKNYWHDKQHKF